MAFTNIGFFSTPQDGSVVFWEGASHSVTNGTVIADSSLGFYNPGDLGTFSKLGIMVEAVSSGGASAFSFFWRGASKFGDIFNVRHTFWTGVTTSSTVQTFSYWGDTNQNKFVTNGSAAGTVSDYMFQVPYLAFGLEVTGANDITYQYVAYAQFV